LGVGSWELGVGGWRLEVGGWRLEVGNELKGKVEKKVPGNFYQAL